MKEIWKPIIDEEIKGSYAISNFGKVIDIETRLVKNWYDNGNGYKIVALAGKESKKRMRYVHRLVAKAFLDNPDNLPQVGHKDHTRANNTVDNLYWTTQKQNTRDGIEAGRINAKKRPNTQKLSKANICEIALVESRGYGVNEIALTLGFPRTTISSVFNGRSNWELFEFAREEIANQLLTSPQNAL